MKHGLGAPRVTQRWTQVMLGIIVASILAPSAQAASVPFNVFVASFGNNTVYRVRDNFGGASVGAGQVFANISGAYSLATRIDDPNVYIGQAVANSKIFRRDSTTGADPDSGSPFISTGIILLDMAFADSNNLQAVGLSSSVFVYNSAGAPLGTYNAASVGPTNQIDGISYDPASGVYLTGVFRLGKFGGSGASYSDTTPSGLAATTFPGTLQQAVKTQDGNLYVTSFASGGTTVNAIYRVNPVTGATTQVFGNSITDSNANVYADFRPVAIGVGPDGLLYFTDYAEGNLFRWDMNTIDAPELVASGFTNPSSLAFVYLPEPAVMGLGVVTALNVLLPRRRNR